METMNKDSLLQHPGVKRSLPFATYMLFILASDLLKPLMPAGVLTDNFTAIIYPVKILAASVLLIIFWKSYDELRLNELKVKYIPAAIVTGVIVFLLWINMDWDFATVGDTDLYDPNSLPQRFFYAFLAVRLTGTALVVPIFEEIFWRSFILRYLINQNFTKVKIGTFTWMSFVVSSLLFGSEHHLWLAGIMAGIFYNLLLYWSRNIYACIIAHGVTNLLLGIYVLKTGSWQFW
jgi:CAAX prenyl protease-like protein